MLCHSKTAFVSVLLAGLRQTCLVPESAIFGAVQELKEKLEELRDNTLLVFVVVNAIWLILILTLLEQPHLKVKGTNALGFGFLVVYGVIILIQFVSLLWHRFTTFFHVVARAPWKRGVQHMVWAFDDKNLPPPPDERTLEAIRQQRGRARPRRRRTEGRRSSLANSHSFASTSTERDPLIPDRKATSVYGSKDLVQSNQLPKLV